MMTRKISAALGAIKHPAAGGQAAAKGNNNMTAIKEPTTAAAGAVDNEAACYDYDTLEGILPPMFVTYEECSGQLWIAGKTNPWEPLAHLCVEHGFDFKGITLPGTKVVATITEADPESDYAQALIQTPEGSVFWEMIPAGGLQMFSVARMEVTDEEMHRAKQCESDALEELENAILRLQNIFLNVFRAAWMPETLPDHWRTQQ